MIALLAAIAVLLIGVVGLKKDPHIPILMSTLVLLLYAVWLGIPWRDLRDRILKSVSESIEAILIICMIGMTIGSWIASGIVPMVIYYGLQIFSPQWFLVSVLVLCSIMSMMTGSSWTTIGTIGVAFMGVGYGLGIPVGITAGAVISGAFFGDKQSPMSDSTNFAAAVARTDLYKHVKSMTFTNLPAWLIALIVFLLLGLQYRNGQADASHVQMITAGLAQEFHFHIFLLLPLIITVTLIVKKFPALPTMMISAISGGVFAVLFQGERVADVIGYMQSGYVANSGIEAVDKLLSRGGLSSMTGTITLMMLSLMLAGVMEQTGIMTTLMEKAACFTRHAFGLITTTLVSTIGLSYFAADPYLAMLLPANALGSEYDRQGIDRSVLSRTMEDGGTTICPIVPWGTNGIYCAATLGVPVLQFMPYYVLGLATPVIAVICAATGIGVIHAKGKEKTKEKAALRAAEVKVKTEGSAENEKYAVSGAKSI